MFPIIFNQTPAEVLYDTGATRSCISEDFYNSLQEKPPLLPLVVSQVRGANGDDLQPLGLITGMVTLGTTIINHRFIVLRKLSMPLILGLDIQRTHKLYQDWAMDGRMLIRTKKEVMVHTIDVVEQTPVVFAKQQIAVPPGGLAVLPTQLRAFDSEKAKEDNLQYYSVEIVDSFAQLFPNLMMIPTIYNVNDRKNVAPIICVNKSTDIILIPKGTKVAELEGIDITRYDLLHPEEYADINVDICHMKLFNDKGNHLQGDRESLTIQNQKKNQKAQEKETDQSKEDTKLPVTPKDCNFVLSPAQEVKESKPKLPDYKCKKKTWEDFLKMTDEYDDIFSACQTDIGHTKLLTMDIDTGDSPPIAQKPYTVALKHAEWLQEELEQLEKAGIIERCVSPWASPIVIVPKKACPGLPPQRRMCVDYRALNSLLPPVTKANSKAKGVLTFVPLPKIEELFGRLKGSKIYTSLDCTSGYHHIGLSEQAQLKSAFVTPYGKFKFKKVPFGLAQAPAYFQQLVNHILSGFTFAFAYLDDILIYSKTEEEHLKHLEMVFKRLREADLKLKKPKCDFFKTQLSYLGHMVSAEGIYPQEEKLKSIKEMPRPTSQKEMRQMLGLTGYYRRFVPLYSDVTKPLTKLTRVTEEFEWSDKAEKAFLQLKQALQEPPILVYPDPNQPYVLFTDASKYAWGGVLTQKVEGIQHPVTYVSGLFRGSQINWAALTKEAFAIYKSFKKLMYYICDAPVILRCDHLPLKKFLKQNTANNVVNNWAVEIESKNITFEFLSGKKNTLADALSRLVKLDITEQQPDEPYGYEFGKYIFEEEPSKVCLVTTRGMVAKAKLPEKTNTEVEAKTLPPVTNDDLAQDDAETELEKGKSYYLKLKTSDLIESQKQDDHCQQIIKLIARGITSPYQLDERGVLIRFTRSGDQSFETVMLPKALVQVLLNLAHDAMGHNGTQRTYEFVKRLYFWKGMGKDIANYCSKCLNCREINLRPQKYPSLHLEVPTMPMHFISMDLIGPFDPSPRGNKHAVTVIDMLTNFFWCIPIPEKTAVEVARAYIHGVYCGYGGSIKLLTDNGTEFKNALFDQLSEQMGMEHRFSSPYHPQGNSRIENAHQFIKNHIRKHHEQDKVPWDDVVDMAAAAYNFFPNQHSRESAFFLMFGRDPITPLNKILGAKLRYLGDNMALLELDELRKCHALAAFNIKLARDKDPNILKTPPTRPLKIGDPVMIRNYVRNTWDPKYLVEYRIISFPSERQVEVVSPTGRVKRVNIQDVHFQYPANQVIRHLPDVSSFGRAVKFVYHPDNIPDLHWSLQKDLLPTNMQPKVQKDTQTQPNVQTFVSKGVQTENKELDKVEGLTSPTENKVCQIKTVEYAEKACQTKPVKISPAKVTFAAKDIADARPLIIFD
jgi:hypothetical protein